MPFGSSCHFVIGVYYVCMCYALFIHWLYALFFFLQQQQHNTRRLFTFWLKKLYMRVCGIYFSWPIECTIRLCSVKFER
jgi:hypothetical protein